MSIVPPSGPIVALRLMSLTSGTASWRVLSVVSTSVETPPPSPEGSPSNASGAPVRVTGAVASPHDEETRETAASAIAADRVRRRFICGCGAGEDRVRQDRQQQASCVPSSGADPPLAPVGRDRGGDAHPCVR